MLQALLRAFSRLPLPFIHRLGAVLGRIVYILSPSYAKRLRENLEISRCYSGMEEYERLLKASISETGKAFLELFPIWFGEGMEKRVLCEDWGTVEKAESAGKGIIFLTPHLGSFEISALYCAQFMPLTVLYRKPKLSWLEPLMNRGRRHVSLAPANLSGVRKLMKALKKGEAIGLLPDQAPGAGEGEWAEFFGRPAYTMTLAGRLADASDAAVIMAFAERLADGKGYRLHLEEITGAITPRSLNEAIEKLVRTCPSQYLWSYNRYKVPSGAKERE
ncbi:MAG TPA: lysophospholipid acyltransferase family protein [Burkholderiales bacterium]|nr:lysophospholipid acyltransferase family protein [Burkholderiales bacterium]